MNKELICKMIYQINVIGMNSFGVLMSDNTTFWNSNLIKNLHGWSHGCTPLWITSWFKNYFICYNLLCKFFTIIGTLPTVYSPPYLPLVMPQFPKKKIFPCYLVYAIAPRVIISLTILRISHPSVERGHHVADIPQLALSWNILKI